MGRIVKVAGICVAVVLSLSSARLATATPTFDRGIGYYVTSGGETLFLGWVSQNFQKDCASGTNVTPILPGAKFYVYGLATPSYPPHLIDFGMSYLSGPKREGRWAARFLPIAGHSEKAYEIQFDGPWDKLESGEIPHACVVFHVSLGPRTMMGDDAAFLFRFQRASAAKKE